MPYKSFLFTQVDLYKDRLYRLLETKKSSFEQSKVYDWLDMIKEYENEATEFNQHNSSYRDVLTRLGQMNTAPNDGQQLLSKDEVSLLFKGTRFEPDTMQCAICAYSVAQLKHSRR